MLGVSAIWLRNSSRPTGGCAERSVFDWGDGFEVSQESFRSAEQSRRADDFRVQESEQLGWPCEGLPPAGYAPKMLRRRQGSFCLREELKRNSSRAAECPRDLRTRKPIPNKTRILPRIGNKSTTRLVKLVGMSGGSSSQCSKNWRCRSLIRCTLCPLAYQNRDEAEDLVQETYVKALKGSRRFSWDQLPGLDVSHLAQCILTSRTA